MTQNFFLSNKTNKKNEAIILLWLNVDHNRIIITTRKKVKPEKWDKRKQRVRGSSYPGLNAYLDQVRAEVSQLYNNLLVNKRQISAKELKQEILANIIRGEGRIIKDETSFNQALNDWIESERGRKAETTIRKYETTRKTLVEYQKAKNTRLTFKSINASFYDKFTQFLYDKGSRRGNSKMLDDSVSKHISVLKVFMKWALERELHENTKFESFKADRKPKVDNVVLRLSELEQLEAYEFSSKRLERVRDIFSFACRTGQRISDVTAFDKSQLSERGGVTVWDFVQKKTGKRIQLPFKGAYVSPALGTLKKYDYALPSISEQKFNEYIKEAGKEAGISEEVKITRKSGNETIEIRQPKHAFLSSHTGRRTFITLLLERGVPATTLQKLTGHSDLRTLAKYENSGFQAVSDALEKL